MLHRRALWSVAIVAIVIAAYGVFGRQPAAPPLPTLVTPTGAEISLHVADTPEERERGLGGRPSLGRKEAMLFVFDEPGRYGFWMKGMLFPLDIIWLDADFRVVHMEENVATSTYPRLYEPPSAASYVLELSAGASAETGIANGAALRPKEKLPR